MQPRRGALHRYLYKGPKRLGPGRPKTYDGKVNWADLSRFDQLDTQDDHIVLYHQVLNHVHFKLNLRVVLVLDTQHNRRAVLFSPSDATAILKQAHAALSEKGILLLEAHTYSAVKNMGEKPPVLVFFR